MEKTIWLVATLLLLSSCGGKAEGDGYYEYNEGGYYYQPYPYGHGHEHEDHHHGEDGHHGEGGRHGEGGHSGHHH